jgi:hypothetical protein
LAREIRLKSLREPKWRRIGPSPWIWTVWVGLSFWLGLAILKVFPKLDLLVGAVALPAALIAMLAVLFVIAVVRLAFGLVAGALIRRVWPPVPTDPPPSLGDPDEDKAIYQRAPRPSYPFLANLRGQCGWVALRLRVDRTGRIRAYQATAQVPPRTFERAIAAGLAHARLAPASAERELATVVTFVTPGPGAPEWAQSRLS